MLLFCHILGYESNRKKSFTKVKFNIFYMMIVICYMLSVICDLQSVTFFSETCYYLQILVPFARCCTSRNFCYLPGKPESYAINFWFNQKTPYSVFTYSIIKNFIIMCFLVLTVLQRIQKTK